jgi:hypothetical protein
VALTKGPGRKLSADNPVDWTKLKSVPSAFSDGIDNGVDNAGFGLDKNVFPNVNFSVDTNEIQKRVSGTCSEDGFAADSVNQDGTLNCSAPSAYSMSDDATGLICDNWCTEGSLALPAGTYFVTAKIEIVGAEFGDVWAQCKLDTSRFSEVDLSTTYLDSPAADYFSFVTLPLQAVTTLNAPGSVSVACRDNGWTDADGGNLKIQAIRVG